MSLMNSPFQIRGFMAHFESALPGKNSNQQTDVDESHTVTTDDAAAELSTSDQRRHELADFLRTRREKIKPEQVGITQVSRRRTPGLRREEVAELAGVGTTWYTWLEQARDIQPSSEVLRRLGSALHLKPAEMRHLFALAGKALPVVVDPSTEIVSESTLRLLNISLKSSPAIVLGHRWDVIASNEEAKALMPTLCTGTLEERNLIHHVFRGDSATRFSGWEANARRVLAEFRASISDSLDNPWVLELVNSMKANSSDFATWWRDHDVRDRQPIFLDSNHPTKGQVRFERQVLRPAEDLKLTILIFVPTP